MVEDNIIIDGEFTPVDTLNLNPDVINDKTVQVVEVEDVKLFTVDTFDAFNALGEPNEQLRHQLLNDRDMADQHPITAITGLRDELDSIEALQTVYSNRKQLADYYKWEDENPLMENRVGYFVSLCEDVRNIKICNGKDIFGVVIDGAAFIGGQDDIVRDHAYGLVLYTGVASVRCELDVEAGDCVTANNYGMAKKTYNDYGCKVIAIKNIDGVRHAIVALNLSIDRIDLMGKDLQSFDKRMGNAEANIVIAMNTANEAYNKACEIGGTSEENLNNTIQGLQGEIDTLKGSINSTNDSVANANKMAIEAKDIAKSAATSVKSTCKEAVDKANEALSGISDLEDELNKTADVINKDLDDVVLNIQALEENLEPLAVWPENSSIEDATGVAGFVARANADSVTLASVTKLEGEFGESLSGFVSKTTSDNAEIQALASYGYIDDDGKKHYGAAGIMAEVDKNKSSIEAIVGKDGSIAGLQAQVDANKSALDIVSKRVYGTYEPVDTWSATNKNQSVVYYAKDTKYYWYYADGAWKNTTNASEAGLSSAIAGIQMQTDDNSSKINDLTSWQGETNTAMARIEQKADANGASITSFVTNIDKYSVGEYSQAYGLTREQAADILEEGIIYVPIKHGTENSHDEIYKYQNSDGIWEEITQTFVVGYYYMWSNTDDGYRWVGSGAPLVYFSSNAPGVNNYSLWYTNCSDGDVNPKYKAKTLYEWQITNDETDEGRWVAVATLKGNASNRAVSMIRQTQNEISAEVTNARGDYSGLDLRLGSQESRFSLLCVKVNPTDISYQIDSTIYNSTDVLPSTGTENYYYVVGTKSPYDVYYWDNSEYKQNTNFIYDGIDLYKIDAASIVGAVNGSESSIAITADHIVLNGYTSNANGSFQIDENGNAYATDMVLKDQFYLYDIANDCYEIAMQARGGIHFPANHYSFTPDAGVSFYCETSFGDDIFLHSSDAGCCMYSNESIYINTNGEAIDGLGREYTVRFSNTDGGRIQPGVNDMMTIGSSNYKWSNIYATTSAIGTSDRNMKDNIKSLTNIHEQFFMKLLPVSFMFKSGTSGRTHIGFISQDVEAAMDELGMTSLDFAGFCKDIKTKPSTTGDGEEPDLDENGNVQYIYSLRYGEFVALNTHMIQKLSQRTNDLEERVAQLEELIKEK